MVGQKDLAAQTGYNGLSILNQNRIDVQPIPGKARLYELKTA
jgi:hypothetical protein